MPTTPGNEWFWTVQVDDLVGGFIVTNYPHPVSEHDLTPGSTKRGIILCECHSLETAERIAEMFNKYGTEGKIL